MHSLQITLLETVTLITSAIAIPSPVIKDSSKENDRHIVTFKFSHAKDASAKAHNLSVIYRSRNIDGLAGMPCVIGILLFQPHSLQ